MPDQSIDTVHTVVPSDDPMKAQQRLDERTEDLRARARFGYRLMSTVPVPSEGATIIVDTLTREND